ncbi:MAG: hypothetical protein Q9202_007560 [Teloschistes flavicans]
MSSYQYSTQDDIQTAAAPQKLSQYCDFITFLGIAQNLSIDFLPITWQQALGNVGKGATAKICEALLDGNTSFAFKRRLFKELFNSEELTGEILPSVVAEISILLTPSIQHCPHIMNIVGICWDIYSGDDDTFSREKPLDFSSAAVVPVLVFEKSRHGDLHSFMTDGVGKGLGYVERLQICIEIAKAISVMHSENVVHGDIKPQNVLVFQTSTEIYTVKVADFGYSTIYATDDDLIQIPRSLHWTAPEWHHRGFSLEQAKKMDIYSLGLLVLWLLCYNNPDSEVPQDHFIMPESTESAVIVIATNLQAVQLRDTAGLVEPFCIILNRNPTDRRSTADYLQTILSDRKYNALIPVSDTVNLYWADYRVRIYIANCLIDAVNASRKDGDDNPPSADLCIQSALCYEVGFGVARNQRKSYEILEGRIAYELQLAGHLRLIRGEHFNVDFSSGIIKWTERSGTVQFIDRINSQVGKTGWEKYQREYRSEIMDASQALGRDNQLVLMLSDHLTDGFRAFGQWQEAETLQAGIVVARIRTLGAKHGDTLASMVILGDIYRRRGRLQKAQDLQVRIYEYYNQRGLAPPCRDVNAESLALTYLKQGQWEKSDELLEAVIHHRSCTHGHEHPKTLQSQVSLVESYMDRGAFERGRQLGTQVLEILRRTQGLQHPDTLRCAAVIAKADMA